MISIDKYRATFIKPDVKVSPKTLKKIKSKSVFKLPSLKVVSPLSIPNYVVGDLIGEGAFAKVRSCIRKIDGQKFVIKIFQKFKVNTDEKRKNIMKEIQILKCIKHANIISIADSFETSQTLNIVMQSFSDTVLSNFAKETRPLEDHILRDIVRQIAQAIHYLHSMKIAHRDLKPENILINSNHEIKIIDLGLAMIGQHHDMKLAGTYHFMSPELVYKKHYDPFASDIWAFGIMLYWLILGYYPQDADDKKKKKCGKLFELNFPIDMHPGLEYLITKMLQENPLQRIVAEDILKDTWVHPIDFKLQINKLIKNMSLKS